MSYDNEGRFRPQNFEDFFAKYDKDRKGGLTVEELWRAWWGQAFVLDLFGWGAAFFECEYCATCDDLFLRDLPGLDGWLTVG